MPGQARHSEKYREASRLGDNETMLYPKREVMGYSVLKNQGGDFPEDAASQHLRNNIGRTRSLDHP
tara:strand:- start:15532 stop:15729 length:198 start_codon:yes stop_codon:yes gene_type:complete